MGFQESGDRCGVVAGFGMPMRYVGGASPWAPARLAAKTVLAPDSRFRAVPKTIAAFILAFVLSLGSGAAAPAAEDEEAGDQDYGREGGISVPGLVELIDKADWIDGYVIFGPALVDAMEQAKPESPVQIRNSVVIGPVRLRDASSAAAYLRDLEQSESPHVIQETWTRGGYSYRTPAHLLDRQVVIDRSVLLSWSAAKGGLARAVVKSFPVEIMFEGEFAVDPPDDPDLSFEAEQVLFRNGFFLTRSRVVGRVFAPGAVFTGQSTFWGTAFRGTANFDAVTFLTDDKSTLSRIPTYYMLRSFPGRPYGFERARFDGKVSFEGAHFASEGGFHATSFAGPASWNGARFVKEADFAAASLQGGAAFQATRFSGPARFDGAEFGQAPNFAEAEFAGPAAFTGAEFKADADFSKVHLAAAADFAAARFRSRANFSGLVFSERALFARGAFDGAARFDNSQFLGPAQFSGAEFADRVELDHSVFSERASFERIRARSEVSAVLSEFVGDTSFDGAVFEGRVNFGLAGFRGGVGIHGARFLRPISFAGATFDRKLELGDLALEEYGDFRGASIHALLFESSTAPSFVAGRLDFRSAHIGTLCLSDVTFLGEVDFTDATLGERGEKPEPPCGRVTEIAALRDINAGVESPGQLSAVVDLVSVSFNEALSFVRTRFHGSVKFEQVRASGLADFTGASFRGVRSITLSFFDFREPVLSWRQLPPVASWQRISGLQPLSEVFAQLESAFRARGRIEDAGAVRYHATRTELEELREAVVGDGGLDWRSARFADWLSAEAAWWVWGLLAGYGTKLWWCLGWAATFTAIFAAAFVLSGDVRRFAGKVPMGGDPTAIKQRVFEFPKDFLGNREAFARIEELRSRLFAALRLSGALLLKVGRRDIVLAADGHRWARNLLRFEWALGYYIVAVLLYTLSETWPLLNRLLAGLF